MVRTRVGYAGGTKPAPTYHSLGNHTETIQIDYDPSQISYNDLLGVFWQNHDPTSQPWSRQYMAAVFFHGEKQKTLAMESKAREAARRMREIRTEILPFTGFTRAEAYHQKYRLRRERILLRELEKIYPAADDLTDSTAAARINGYLSGHGNAEQLNVDLERLGLSIEGREELQRIASYKLK